MDLTDKKQLIEYLQKNGLYTKNSLGQNFLVDKGALEKIVEAAGLVPHPTSPCEGEENKGDLVIEVGPGVGTMTQELVKYANDVLAVEIDEKLAGLLMSGSAAVRGDGIPDQVRDDKLVVINEDILKVNIPELVGGRKYKVVANIPYYITSKIINLFLTTALKPETIVVLTQKEVAERICAKPGEMSVLSVSVQTYGEPEIVGIVPSSSFFPAPKVDSAILRIKNIHEFNKNVMGSLASLNPPTGGFAMGRDDRIINEKDFFRTVHIGFASRRKTLLNNLMAGYHIKREKAEDIIKSVGLNENVRAQELGISQWKTLTNKLSNVNFQ